MNSNNSLNSANEALSHEALTILSRPLDMAPVPLPEGAPGTPLTRSSGIYYRDTSMAPVPLPEGAPGTPLTRSSGFYDVSTSNRIFIDGGEYEFIRTNSDSLLESGVYLLNAPRIERVSPDMEHQVIEALERRLRAIETPTMLQRNIAICSCCPNGIHIPHVYENDDEVPLALRIFPRATGDNQNINDDASLDAEVNRILFPSDEDDVEEH